MGTFDYDSLWNKSKVFIDRAVRARDDADGEQFHFWASLALELLGKAALARIHPCLVADPQHFESLLAACDRGNDPKVRSIQATTLYERLGKIFPGFDEQTKKTCLLMAERRNAEIHSGQAALHGLDQGTWVPSYWSTASVLLDAQGRTLEEWLGGPEAARVREVIADRDHLIREHVLARIARRAAEYDLRFPPGSNERSRAFAASETAEVPGRLLRGWDATTQHECPACHSKAWLLGSIAYEEVLEPAAVELDPDDPDSGWPVDTELVEITYSVNEFACTECDLRLGGHAELRAADIPTEFEETEEREPQYEPDYGNE